MSFIGMECLNIEPNIAAVYVSSVDGKYASQGKLGCAILASHAASEVSTPVKEKAVGVSTCM